MKFKGWYDFVSWQPRHPMWSLQDGIAFCGNMFQVEWPEQYPILVEQINEGEERASQPNHDGVKIKQSSVDVGKNQLVVETTENCQWKHPIKGWLTQAAVS